MILCLIALDVSEHVPLCQLEDLHDQVLLQHLQALPDQLLLGQLLFELGIQVREVFGASPEFGDQ